jgi:hypothetical protein
LRSQMGFFLLYKKVSHHLPSKEWRSRMPLGIIGVWVKEWLWRRRKLVTLNFNLQMFFEKG